MKKIIYIANIRIPTERAHGIQIINMCEAFAHEGIEVELLVPWRFNDIYEDTFLYYDLGLILTFFDNFLYQNSGVILIFFDSFLFRRKDAKAQSFFFPSFAVSLFFKAH